EDRPEYVIARHALRNGKGDAYRHGDALVVSPLLTPGELLAFGNDVESIWRAVQEVPAWSCVEVRRELAEPLAECMRRNLTARVRVVTDVYYAMERPAIVFNHPAVRLLTAEDANLYAR